MPVIDSVQKTCVHKAKLTIILIIYVIVCDVRHKCLLSMLTGVHIKQVNFRENIGTFCRTNKTVLCIWVSMLSRYPQSGLALYFVQDCSYTFSFWPLA